MLEPLISIIVPIYNTEQYLDECVKSIVMQSYNNLEILLVDDGSVDHSPEICDRWAKQDQRIKVIHRRNGGASAARNMALKMARGDLVGFVDSDDYCHKTMFEDLFKAIIDSRKGIAYCSSFYVTSEKRILPTVHKEQEKILNVVDAIKAIFAEEVDTGMCSKLFKRAVFKDVFFPEGESNEEFSILIPLIHNADGIVCIGKSRYYHRENDKGVTSASFKNESSSGLVHKNLKRIKVQLDEYKLPCLKEYRYFAASCALNSALAMEKNYDSLSEKIRDDYKVYRKIMWDNAACFLLSSNGSVKKKILFILVLTRLLCPVYSVFYKDHL